MRQKLQEQVNWINENIEVQNWIQDLAKRSKATANTRCDHLYHYSRWLKEEKGINTINELLKHYECLKEKYLHNAWIKEFLLNEKNKKKSLAWKQGGLSSIRSFYQFHHCSLPNERIDLRVRDIDVALLPIMGRATMDLDEAVETAIALHPKIAIPMHRRDAGAEEFKEKVEAKSDAKVLTIAEGDEVNP